MITARAWAGKRYAVLGLARSGAATVRALVASGARVQAWDENEERRAAILPSSAGEGDRSAKPSGGGAFDPGVSPGSEAPPPLALRAVPLPASGEDQLTIAPLDDLSGFDALVLSPGVPLNTHPLAARARAQGVPIIGDIELFAQARGELPPHKVVGITGTNGKSTTTALIHHILQTAGVPSLMGGNIGLPILAQEPLPAGGVYVLELSSYQLDLTQTLDCDVAVLTNITPDHLDRYESFEAYRDSKLRLFLMQSRGREGVIASDDATLCEIINEWTAGPGGWWLRPEGLPLGYPDQHLWPALQGPHNAENVFAAQAATVTLGVHIDIRDEGYRTYPGLPHRMQRVAQKGGVLYVNDSKATNATAAAPALAAYPAVHWILGGRAKTDELDECVPHFGHVRAGYTIGEAGPLFARLLRAANKPVTESGTLDRAVRDAAAAARPGETVLLSPACASFDQFRDFEARGEAFVAAVEALP